MESTISIPNKSVFKLNEVCGITGVKPYVLRFWESEFEEISPITSSSGQKLYEHNDIETVSRVKKLLFDDKLTIDQAKQQINAGFIVDDEPLETLPQSVDELAPFAEIIDNQQRILTDLEVQKLVLSKAKLNSIISLIDRR